MRSNALQKIKHDKVKGVTTFRGCVTHRIKMTSAMEKLVRYRWLKKLFRSLNSRDARGSRVVVQTIFSHTKRSWLIQCEVCSSNYNHRCERMQIWIKHASTTAKRTSAKRWHQVASILKVACYSVSQSSAWKKFVSTTLPFSCQNKIRVCCSNWIRNLTTYGN